MESRISKVLNQHHELYTFDGVKRVIVSNDLMAGQPKFVIEEKANGIEYYLNLKVDAERDPLYGLLMEDAGYRWSPNDDFEDNPIHHEYSKLRLVATVNSGKIRSIFDFVRDEKFRLNGVETIVEDLVRASPPPAFIAGIASVFGSNLVNSFILNLVRSPDLYLELEKLIFDRDAEIPENWRQFTELITEIRYDPETFKGYFKNNVEPVARSLIENSINFEKEIIFSNDQRRFTISFNFETKNELILVKNYTSLDFDNLKKGLYLFLKAKSAKKPVIYNFLTNKRYEFAFSDIVLDEEITMEAVSIVGKEIYFERKYQVLHYDKNNDEFFVEILSKDGKETLGKRVPIRTIKEIIDNHKFRD